MKKKQGGVILLVILAVLLVGAFAVVAYRTPKSSEEIELSQKDELLNKNILANYPSTPREVLKLFNRFIVVLYGTDSEELTSEEQQALGVKLRDLYDEELLEANPQDTNLTNLAQELLSFQSNAKVLLQANVCDSNEVEYISIDGVDGALVDVSYFIKANSKKFTRTYQRFLLRKDDAGQWKILGFDKIDEENVDS